LVLLFEKIELARQCPGFAAIMGKLFKFAFGKKGSQEYHNNDLILFSKHGYVL